MNAVVRCPSESQLRRLLAAPTEDHEDLVHHLDHCETCRRVLEKLTGATQVLLSAASAARQEEYANEAPSRRVLNELASNAGLRTHYLPQTRMTTDGQTPPPPGVLEPLGRLDEYEVADVLGRGGMGLVYRAFDPALKRWVAIKLLIPSLADDPTARLRFAREAQAAAAVRHEHVVTIHAVSDVDGVPYFVMEYLSGGSLQDYLDRHGPPSWPAAVRMAIQIVSGLAAAHAKGLIHRDIKPSNILLETEGTADDLGTAKLSDFGLARAADESRLTQTGVAAPGTPMYMAPEQARGEPLDQRADLFSLGSVLYALCTGREPFGGGGPIAVLHQVCETTPTPIRKINPAVPPWFAAVVQRLHAKRPADRFASAAEVEELLRHNLDNPTRPLVPRRVEVTRRWRRLLAGGVLAVALVAGSFGLSEALHWTHITSWGASAALRATLKGHTGPVWSVAFDPDGSVLATGSDDTTLRLWDPATGQDRGVLTGHNGAVLAVTFAHSGKFLVSGGGDGAIRLWNIEERRQESLLPLRNGNVRRVAIFPDDRTLAVATNTQGVELWDLETQTLRKVLPGRQGSIQSLSIAADGRTLATGDARGRIRFWDAATGEERSSFDADPLGVRALAFSPDGRRLASAGAGDKGVKLWDVETQRLVGTFADRDNEIQSVAFSRDGSHFAAGGRDGVVTVWDAHSLHVLATVQAHQSIVWSLAFSPDGRTLATVGEDRVGKLWIVSPVSPTRERGRRFRTFPLARASG